MFGWMDDGCDFDRWDEYDRERGEAPGERPGGRERESERASELN